MNTAAQITTDPIKVREAKRKFILSLLDFSWRMLIAMVLPIFVGAYLDNKFQTGQIYTAIGFILSFISGGLVIRSTARKFSDKKGAD